MATFEGADNFLRAIAIDDDGNVYIGGAFRYVDDDVTDKYYVAKWNGSNWLALGDGITPIGNGGVFGLSIDDSNNVYIGGSFSGTEEPITSYCALFYDKTKLNALWAGFDDVESTVSNIIKLKSGLFCVAGWFTKATFGGGAIRLSRIAMWNDAIFTSLGDGLSASDTTPPGTAQNFTPAVWGLFETDTGAVYAGGIFDYAGDVDLQFTGGMARWDGTTWQDFPIKVIGFAKVYSFAKWRNKIYFGHSSWTAGTTALVLSANTITNSGTAISYPVVQIVGPCTINEIRNKTSGDVIKFGNSKLLSDEILTIDFRYGITASSSVFGNVTNYIRSGSERMRIMPGVNTIGVLALPLYEIVGDTEGCLKGLDRITGISLANTDNYKLYVTINTGLFEFYSDAARTNLVAHTDTVVYGVTATIIEDDSSGLGGYFCSYGELTDNATITVTFPSETPTARIMWEITHNSIDAGVR